jgi:uncharacterized radical SAM superfamily Fe-S cluster-containing enzyme
MFLHVSQPRNTDYEPTKEALVDMLEFVAKANPKPPAILFSGGDPLEREDMPEIIGVAHKLKFMTILATNGTHIAKHPELAEKLKKNGLNIVYLQFDSFHDDFYRQSEAKSSFTTNSKQSKSAANTTSKSYSSTRS